QKCVRAGGKHNDLENVGVTARHHTFFEMLGNFSFGDYFKEEAIAWSWEYLTEVVKLPKNKLWVTIYKDDEEAFHIWHKKMQIPAERIIRMGEETNFWMMGDSGPCGPCSEILFDQGEGTGCGLESCAAGCDCDRYLEIWNLVFTQFDRDQSGEMTPLPKPNIDTGMGLERLTAVLQGAKSNYDCDLFQPIIDAITVSTGKTYGKNEEDDISIRVIADHGRAITFLIGDGIMPANEGRGYVLRRILRRAARHGKLLGMTRPFLQEVAHRVIQIMAETYPDLAHKGAFIEKVIQNEEQRFRETLEGGLNILQEQIQLLTARGEKTIPGEVVFKLYDTYGFPTDLTEDIVRKDGFQIDMDGFHQAMAGQREKSRESWKGSGEATIAEHYQDLAQAGIRTTFQGYEGNTGGTSRVTALMKDGLVVGELGAGEEGEIFLENTPFYGEVGGQCGDCGIMTTEDSLFRVRDAKRPLDELISHVGLVEKGTIRVGDSLNLMVQQERRRAIEANHSATHLLQAALKSQLGDHVKQSGSMVSAERLRFDFT
ncbi:MAG: alanine--tRNA ligase, partial [Smithellaceae bacterium]|nr:alanine--tRNA ligase [Smithellaceae bacterium]